MEKGDKLYLAQATFRRDGATVNRGEFISLSEAEAESLSGKQIVQPVAEVDTGQTPELMEVDTGGFVLGLEQGQALYVLDTGGVVQNAEPLSDLDEAIEAAEEAGSSAQTTV